MEVQLIIDWHNYAHSIMALSLGKNHALVRLAKFIEMTFGHRAGLNFCVSNAMQQDLKEKWSIKLVLFTDILKILFLKTRKFNIYLRII